MGDLMPLNRHFGGHGAEVMANMEKEYGSERAKRIFYATENARKKHKVKRDVEKAKRKK